MSVSDRQRRGAFEVCWSDIEFVVAMLFEVVPQAVSAVPSKPAVPPTPVPVVLPPVVPAVPPAVGMPLSTLSRVPHDSTPDPAVPEPAVRHTRDTYHPYPLRTPPAHVPALARTREPPSGGCPAARDTPAIRICPAVSPTPTHTRLTRSQPACQPHVASHRASTRFARPSAPRCKGPTASVDEVVSLSSPTARDVDVRVVSPCNSGPVGLGGSLVALCTRYTRLSLGIGNLTPTLEKIYKST